MASSYRNLMLTRTKFGNKNGVMSLEGGASGRIIMPRGFYEVIAIGGGGGWAVSSNKEPGTYGSTLGGNFSVASGGGAASVKCRIELAESGTAEYAVGSRGEGSDMFGDAKTATAGSGGDTSLAVNGISILCPGGKGGKANASNKGTGGAGGAAPTIVGAYGTVQSGGGGAGTANFSTSLSHGAMVDSTKGSVVVEVAKSTLKYYGQGGSATIYFDGFESSKNDLSYGRVDGMAGLLRLTYFGTVRPADWE